MNCYCAGQFHVEQDTNRSEITRICAEDCFSSFSLREKTNHILTGSEGQIFLSLKKHTHTKVPQK